MTTPAAALRVVMAPAEIMAILDRYGFVCGDRESDCNRARAAIAQALEDARRLDWLMGQAAVVTTDGNDRWHVFFDWLPAGSQYGPWADNQRAAIDAAIAATEAAHD